MKILIYNSGGGLGDSIQLLDIIYSLKKNVVGKDIKFPKPYKNNLTIINKFDQAYKKNIKKIISLIKR